MELIEIFETLVKIPSPSLSEDKVADKIIEILTTNNIEAKKDKTGNVIAKIKGNNPLKKPLILSAHMDVVGDDSPINIVHNGNITKKELLAQMTKRALLPQLNWHLNLTIQILIMAAWNLFLQEMKNKI